MPENTIQPDNQGSIQATGSPKWVESLDDYRASMLPVCAICGTDPDELAPRIYEEKAMGSVWRYHCICWVCGGSHTGNTVQDAVDRWNSERLPNYHFDLPQDCSDMEENGKGSAAE